MLFIKIKTILILLKKEIKIFKIFFELFTIQLLGD